MAIDINELVEVTLMCEYVDDANATYLRVFYMAGPDKVELVRVLAAASRHNPEVYQKFIALGHSAFQAAMEIKGALSVEDVAKDLN